MKTRITKVYAIVITLLTMSQLVYPQSSTYFSTHNSNIKFRTNDSLRMSIAKDGGLVHVYKDLKVDGK